jgi:hypothetical protein
MLNPKTVFFIDKVKFTSETDTLTPRQILVDYAKEDPNQTVLVRIDGPNRTKLTDVDTPIQVKDGTHFTILHLGPTPVS